MDRERAESCKEELMRLYRSRTPETEPADDIDQRYPEPDLSELDDEVTEPDPQPEKGFILVNVRTGGGALPIEGASVTVTASGDGRRIIVGAAVTDISGSTIRMTVPAPELRYSQEPDPAVQPYSLFDITVTAPGYFNARSVDVPVFPGITSIQDFGMVPVPLYMRSTDETLTFCNQFAIR